MLSELLLLSYKQTPLIKEEKNFHLVFIEMQMYGPRQGSRILPWANVKFFSKRFLYVIQI